MKWEEESLADGVEAGERALGMDARRRVAVAGGSLRERRAHRAQRHLERHDIGRIARIEQRREEERGSAPRRGRKRASPRRTILKRRGSARDDARELWHGPPPHRAADVGEQR